MRKLATIPVLVVLTALVMGACSSGDDANNAEEPAEEATTTEAATSETTAAQAKSAAIDPCALITDEEAAAALDGAAGTWKGSPGDDVSASCSYEREDLTGSLLLTVYTYSKEDARTFFDGAMKAAVSAGFGEEVATTGGDAAYYSSAGNLVAVLKGDIYFVLSSGAAIDKAVLAELSTKALAKATA